MAFINYLHKQLASFYSNDQFDIDALALKQRYTVTDLYALLSTLPNNVLEAIAQKAATLTRCHFGGSVLLFTPLYISNYCRNNCPYCSFSTNNSVNRSQLTIDQIEKVSLRIANTGMRHILVLTGEDHHKSSFSYIKESLSKIREHFSSIGIEIYPLNNNQYSDLVKNSLIDSLTIYQETYDQNIYEKLHTRGPKSDYAFRLATAERALSQGVRSITIGALLGLVDFKQEAMALALHCDYLQHHYPAAELTVSFPRIKPLVSDFTVKNPISDRELTQLVIAFRLIFPNIGITMSTRETASIRDGLVQIGVTKMSAGVSTAVGGTDMDTSQTQFEISDQRSLSEMKNDLHKMGYNPILHDWNLQMSL